MSATKTINSIIRTQREITDLHKQAVDADTPEGNVVATTIDWLLDKEAVSPLEVAEDEDEEDDTEFDDEDIDGDLEEEEVVEEEKVKK